MTGVSRVQVKNEFLPKGTDRPLVVYGTTPDISEGFDIQDRTRTVATGILGLARHRGKWIGQDPNVIGDVGNADGYWDFYAVAEPSITDNGGDASRVLGFLMIDRLAQRDDRTLRIDTMLFHRNLVNARWDPDGSKYRRVVGALLRTAVEDHPDVENVVITDDRVSMRGRLFLPDFGMSLTDSDMCEAPVVIGIEGGAKEILDATAFLGPNVHRAVRESA